MPETKCTHCDCCWPLKGFCCRCKAAKPLYRVRWISVRGTEGASKPMVHRMAISWAVHWNTEYPKSQNWLERVEYPAGTHSKEE